VKHVEALFRVLFVVGIAALCFLFGAWSAWREGSLYVRKLRPAFVGAAALLEARRVAAPHPQREKPQPPAQPAQTEKQPREQQPKGDGRPRGVVTFDKARASAGLTLAVVGQGAHLIELDGTIRHTWQLPYERLRNGKELLQEPPLESRLYWRPARALPNGDLVAVVDLKNSSPEGLAIVRMDRDSRPLWVYHGHVHHDFDIAPDGRVFALGMGVRAEPPQGLRGLAGPMMDERLLILSPKGELLQDISLIDAFANSPYARLVMRTVGDLKYRKGDYLHSNNVDVVDAATAARFPFAKEGQVLLSLRELNALAVIDVERRVIVWARQDEWVKQHDPDFLDNGNLLIFDNQGDYRTKVGTRVIEYEPRTGAIVWQYAPVGDRRLQTRIRGDQQRLPNGNTLINDWGRGRLVEVTREGEVAWELKSDFTLPVGQRRYKSVMYTERYAPGELHFTFNEGRPALPR
jgi:hypothetical protein